MDFKRIIKKCLLNDRRAQTLLYDHYADAVGKICIRYASSQENAKDILQESFIKIFTSLKIEFKDQEHFEAWMKRIVINTALNHQRKEKKYRDKIYQDKMIMNQVDSKEITSEKIVSALKGLPLKYKHIINLIIVDGYSHKEAAEILGIQDSSSRARYSRAIQMLRHTLIPETKLSCDGE